MARRIEIEITGDSRSLERAFSRVQGSGSRLERTLRGVGKASALAIGVGAGAGLVGLGIAAHAGVKELEQAQKAAAQTEAVIKSTGGAAHVTSKQVDELSNSLLNKTGIDDEVIQSGENMLLTFRNVRNEVGKGNDIFTQATKVGLDMSTALEGAGFEGGNLKTTMIRLGKALNDPITGMTALRRVGVTFTEGQKATIKRLEETGHHLQAQKLILRELRAEFGGSAEAYGKTLPGQLTIFRERLRNVAAFIVGKFLPVFTEGTNQIIKFGDFISKVAHAPNIKVGLEITEKGVKQFAVNVKNSLSRALMGSTETIAAGPTGFLAVYHKGLLQQIQGADWRPVGKAIAAGIGASLVFTGTVMDRLLTSMLAWAQAHAGQIAEVGVIIAANIAMKLTDPAFWAHHMTLLAGVLLLAFGGSIGKVAGRFGAAMGEALGPGLRKGAAELVSIVAVEFGKLPRAVQVALEVGGRSLLGAVRALWAAIMRPLGEEAGRLTTFLARAFRLGAVVSVFRLGLEGIKSAWSNFEDWIQVKALLLVRKIVEPFSHLPLGLGGWAQRAKDRVNAALDSIEAERFARRMERAAARVAATSPQIAQARDAAAALARALKSVPSDTTIRFIVKTLTFTPGTSPRGGAFQGGGHAAGGRITGPSNRDAVPAMLAGGEFVVTRGGERMLESMTFPGVLNWLQGAQPRHFAGGGRASVTKNIEYDRLYTPPAPVGGGAVSTRGLVPQVTRALHWARGHGWHGSVSSGWRSYAEQARLYQRYLAGGPLAARPGTSSHERGQAVDVTDYGTFGMTMSSAPPGSRLYNYLGARDPVHYSVSGYQAGGRVAGPGGGPGRPHLPTPPPSPLPGLRRRIAALRAEERKVKAQVNRLASQLAHTPKKNKAARKRLEKQLNAARAHLRSIQAQLQALGERVREAVGHDYSALPAQVEYELAQAALTDTPADDAVALSHAEQYLLGQLRRPGITLQQRTQILQQLAGVREQMRGLQVAPSDAAAAAAAGGAEPSADLQAQLEQAQRRVAVAEEAARLANAFVATGVFDTATSGAPRLGGGPTIVVQSLIPDAAQIVRAAEAIAQGAGTQPYVPTSTVKTGL